MVSEKINIDNKEESLVLPIPTQMIVKLMDQIEQNSLNNKIEEKIDSGYHGGRWKTGIKSDEMVRLFASNGAYNGTNYSEFPKMEDEHEHTFDNQASQLVKTDGPAIMDRCSKTNLNGEAKGEDYDIQPLSMDFSMFDTVDEGIKVV